MTTAGQLKLPQQTHEVGLRRLNPQSPEGDFVHLLPQIHLPGAQGRVRLLPNNLFEDIRP